LSLLCTRIVSSMQMTLPAVGFGLEVRSFVEAVGR